jgi:hypothetical protein
MIVADVGQSAWEEANYEPAGRGGRNYGWRIREGAHPNPAFGDPTTAGLTDPVIEYSHAVGNAITGGPVNRGSSLGLSNFGRYFFADLNGRVWSAGLTIDRTTGEATTADITEHTADIGSVGTPVAFGRDAACRIFIVDYSGGRIVRLLPASMSTASVCATPDPFLSLGGGVWLGDSWVRACPGSAPASGWVCVNGGWVPPDHPLAGGTPPPPPPPPSSPGGCTGPDPFTGIPGLSGVCVNGGWVPAGHPLAKGG